MYRSRRVTKTVTAVSYDRTKMATGVPLVSALTSKKTLDSNMASKANPGSNTLLLKHEEIIG